MNSMKRACVLGLIRWLTPVVVWLCCWGKDAPAQCPPDLVPYSASEVYGSAEAYQGCYSSRYQSRPRRGLLGARLRPAIRSRAVYQPENVGWTPRPSPRVIYSTPQSADFRSEETYSSYSGMTSYQTCTPVYSVPPSVGGAMGSAGYPGVMCSPGPCVTRSSVYLRSYP
jgi:hypothetical protein